MVAAVNDATTSSWRRWFRRTNVYIAEYILMLVLVGSFIGILTALWFSFFGLLYEASSLNVSVAASQIGALLVVGPAAFWMYSRVTGEEMMHPDLYERKSRTVFLTIWMFFAVLTLVGMVVAVVSTFVNSIFGLGGDFGAALVKSVIPGLFAVATLGFGLSMVVKHTSRKFVMVAALVLTVSAFVLLIANTTMVLVRKGDAKSTPNYTPSLLNQQRPGSDSDDGCSFSDYYSGDCTYEEYRRSLGSGSSGSSLYR